MKIRSFIVIAAASLAAISSNALASDVTVESRFGKLYHDQGELMFKDTPISPETNIANKKDVLKKFELADRDVFIVDQSHNCRQTFTIITVTKDAAWHSGDLGMCVDAPLEISQSGQDIVVKVGKSLTYTYKPDGYVYANGKKKTDSKML